MPAGRWIVNAPSALELGGSTREVHFHIVAEGFCWLKLDNQKIELEPGDVVALPLGSAHQLGAGRNGSSLSPFDDLKSNYDGSIPTLQYGDATNRARIFCGYLNCDALDFGPIKSAMPTILHVRTVNSSEANWLRTIVLQVMTEFDRPSPGCGAMLERLTELMFVELLRRQMTGARGLGSGWMAAIADPVVGKCLSAIHESPESQWTIDSLAKTARASKSVLWERFQRFLGVSPIQYVRDWRLHLATLQLTGSPVGISEIAYQAGYSSEATFNRAFKKQYGLPPGAWRASRI